MSELNMILPEKVVVEPEAQTTEQRPSGETLYPISGIDRKFAGVMFVLAFLAVDTFNLFTNHEYYGVGVTVYTLCYGISILLYARFSQRKVGREGTFWFVVMGLSAVSYTWVYHQSLMMFQALFLRLVTLYFTISVFGVQMEGKTGNFFLLDGINALTAIPLANRKAQWKALQTENKQAQWLLSVGKAFLGLVVALPLFAVVLSLLSSADDNFSIIFEKLMERMGDSVFTWGGNLILAIPVGIYLFGLAYGAAHERETHQFEPDKVTLFCRRCGVIPRASIYTIIVCICLMYGLFIGLQGSYYLEVISGVLPEGFTYSHYARQGFFELATVSVINVGIILASALFCSRVRTDDGVSKKDQFLRWSNVVISVMTLFLIATAMTKMLLYIRAYGLTPLRVIPSVFMLFLMVLFLLIIVAQVRNIPVVRIGVYVFALGFAALSVSNMDGRIASYNLERYQAGTITDYPKAVLRDGSLASVPAMYRVWSSTENEQLKANLCDTADDIWRWYGEEIAQSSSLKTANITKNNALWQLEEMGKEYRKIN